MNNTIEFIVKMRDMMSSGINRLSTTSQSSFTRMANGANHATQRNNILGLSFNELQKKIRQTEDTIKNSTIPSQISAARAQLSALQRQASSHSGNIGGRSFGGGMSSIAPSGGNGIGDLAIGNALGGMIQQGAQMIVSAVASGVGSVITKTMEKEQAIVGLSTFLGKKGATEAYNNIRKDAAVTPFDTASLLMVNRSLISAGLNAKDARRDTLNLGNAVAAVGGGNDILSRMAVNMQQIKTIGKATSVDIKQFGFAGINIYEMLARSTGKNIEQVKEMDVTYAQLAKALEMSAAPGGMYAGAMEAQSRTMAGRWATFKDNMSNLASDVGDAFSPVFDKILDHTVQFAEWLPKGLEKSQPLINEMSTGFNSIVDYVANMVNGTSEWSGWIELAKERFTTIWNYAKLIGGKIGEFVGSLMQFISKSEIFKDIFRFVGWVMEKLFNILYAFIDAVTWLWNNVLRPILEAVNKAYMWIKGKSDVNIKATQTLVTPKKSDDKNNPTSGARMMADNVAAGKDAGSTVGGGGPKVINIHVGKFFDNLQFTTLNTGESAQEIENIVMECFSRVVYQGSKLI